MIVVILIVLPFLPWKLMYEYIWQKFRLFFPDSVDQFDTLLRKKWPLFQTSHLFFISFILVTISIIFFLVGNFLRWPTVPLPVGVMGGVLIPFLFIYILKPNIESSFLFEVRNIYTTLRTQIAAGASPVEALELVTDMADIMKQDIEEIKLVWGKKLDDTLKKIAKKYSTDELDILLSLIREMHNAGSSDQKEVMKSFDRMKEMMEDEISAKEAANDEKEMDYLEVSSNAFIFSLIFLMIVPVVGDIIGRLINLGS